MISYERPLLDFLFRTHGVNLADLPEVLESLACLIRGIFDDFQRTKAQLRKQVTSLEEHNKELAVVCLLNNHK
jgi:hypothetical protein